MKEGKGGNFSKSPDPKPLFLLIVKIKQNAACRNKEYNLAFKHFHENIRIYPRSYKKSALINDWENVAYWEKWGKCCISRGSRKSQESFAFFLLF